MHQKLKQHQIKRIVHHATASTEELGFIPEEAYHRANKESRLFATFGDGECLAFLFAGSPRMHQRIFQAWTLPEERLAGRQAAIATELQRYIDAMHVCEHVLHVAEELPAVKFWEHCGFVIHAELPRNHARGRRVLEMRRRTKWADQVDARLKERLPTIGARLMAEACGKLALIKNQILAELKEQP